MVEDSGRVTDDFPTNQHINTWEQLGLDARILKALKKKGFDCPTEVQSRAIPLVLSGKDVIARAHTGSGKTLAYLLPMIHKIMRDQEIHFLNNPRALVLVPTRELANQVKDEAALLLDLCAHSLRAGELPGAGSTDGLLREFAGAPPEVLIATPARLLQCIHDGLFPSGSLTTSLELLVLDEADLLLSYGYQEDIRRIAEVVQRGCQCMLLSATFKDDLLSFGAFVLHNPVHLNLEDAVAQRRQNSLSLLDGPLTREPRISHFTLEVCAQDKLLYCLALLRFGLCERKTLIFVLHPDTAIRLRLFLDKFGISCCALHDQLPANSRTHVLQEFNRGIYDHMIAVADDAHNDMDGPNAMPSDDTELCFESRFRDKPDRKKMKKKKKKKKEEEEEEAEEEEEEKANKKKSDSVRDGMIRDFGVVRGIDFKQVRTVVNFDMPLSASSYLHRIGRTGRAGQTGTAITFVTKADENRMRGLHQGLLTLGGNAAAVANEMTPFKRLPESSAEALRYRVEDTARTVGRAAVREARVREIQAELLNSQRLASHFEENPEDLSLLKHDITLSKQRPLPHLTHLPTYLRANKYDINMMMHQKTSSCNKSMDELREAKVKIPEFDMRKRSRQSHLASKNKYRKEKTEPKLKVKELLGKRK